MISESAQELIQRVSQSLFSDRCESMRDRPWSAVELQVQYDEKGGYIHNCQMSQTPEAAETVTVALTDDVEGALLSLDKHRTDANGKQWIGLSIAISQAGEAKIQLAYAEPDVGEVKGKLI